MHIAVVQGSEVCTMKTALLLLGMILWGRSEAANITDEEGLYTYRAAIVEYFPIRNTSLTTDEILVQNTLEYISLLNSVTQDIDLIVFPESTLTSGGGASSTSEVPVPFTDIICNSTDTRYHDYLKNLSCAAIEHNTTVVINIVEKENCTLNNATGFCPSSGIVYYNSDVAFNESGGVSGRYRKWNLFGEYNLSPPAVVELTTITTRNNVSFGIFTCFDILFDEPALKLIRNLGLKNILFPSMWFSELPFLTALQVQQMWAEENNVTLLSAGANNPSIGSGGTGIFIGMYCLSSQGPLEYEMISGSGGTRIITQTVPKLEVANNPYVQFAPVEEDTDSIALEMDSFYLIVDPSVFDSTSVLLDTNKTTISEEVCNGDSVKICCEFNITISINQSISNAPDKNQYVYHLVAYDNARSFSGVRDGGIESCGLLACLNESLASCGSRFSNYSDVVWPMTFENVSVAANFVKSENRTQFPNSLLSSIRPLSPQYTVWESEETDSIVRRRHAIVRPQTRLLTFGIYGRDFSRDSPVRDNSDNSAKVAHVNAFIFLCTLLCYFLI
ncbi:hypothetical protein NQ318_011238 [Aromia moschata]|uniref:CN hydrolase domain-containing protein n=1 Tax=Aromia moschata TaxID=1265417 RepID=A0AAV8YIF2_9CUCU|nr:hypothetical protein NQ318_011238 [Aromia moschata]